jgi:hypothetical protein
MKRTEFWKWMTWNEVKGKMTKTNYLMTEEDALARHPEAVKVPGSCEVRDLPETDEEKAANWPSTWQKLKP